MRLKSASLNLPLTAVEKAYTCAVVVEGSVCGVGVWGSRGQG